jgi:hypothetical protein
MLSYFYWPIIVSKKLYVYCAQVKNIAQERYIYCVFILGQHAWMGILWFICLIRPNQLLNVHCNLLLFLFRKTQRAHQKQVTS